MVSDARTKAPGPLINPERVTVRLGFSIWMLSLPVGSTVLLESSRALAPLNPAAEPAVIAQGLAMALLPVRAVAAPIDPPLNCSETGPNAEALGTM